MYDEETIRDFFQQTSSAASENNEEEVNRLLEQLKKNGCEFDVISTEITEWEEDGAYKYATVIQNNQLTLGNVVVAEWEKSFIGDYGSMGTGWWVTEFDNSGMADGIEELLDLLEIYFVNPNVPEPIMIESD